MPGDMAGTLAESALVCFNNKCYNASVARPGANQSQDTFDPDFGYRDAIWTLTTSIMVMQMQTGEYFISINDCRYSVQFPSGTFMNLSGNLGAATQKPDQYFGYRDAIWTLTSSIMVLQMQTGFGLLEAGCVSVKSEINIMVKNALDVVFGGVTYWAFGFAFSFGDGPGSNPFIGVGHFFVNVPEERMGYIYALFLFQLSFATTSTTIVSGAMAERTKLISYNVFSMCMTLIYCIPAHWVWAENGFLYKLGAQDIAGCGPVHLVGGVTGLVATLMIGPRKGAFDSDERQPLPSALKAILGMFMLWWGWLRFNSGSVFVVSSSEQWKFAVRAAVNTIVASMGGGISSVVFSVLMSKCCKKQKRFPYDIGTIINGVLGSLVSITAICTLCEPWEAFAIGIVGVCLTIPAEMVVSRLRIDDPVGVIPVHAVCSIWGLITVGLFLPEERSLIKGQGGLFKTGQFYMLGIQLLVAVVIIVWTLIMSSFFLKTIDLLIGLRLDKEHEMIGADIVEHGIGTQQSAAEMAAESVLSLTDLGEGAVADEFKGKVNQLLRDFFKSVCKNELYMTVHQHEQGTLVLEIRSHNSTPSVDSGMGDDANVEAAGSKREGEAIRHRRIAPYMTTDGANGSLGKNITGRPSSGRGTRHVNVIRLGPHATQIENTDDAGHSTTQTINLQEQDRPETSGFEAVAAPY